MIEQLTRYYVPLKDDMSKFEELCERKRLKKRDLAVIFEHVDINHKTQKELLKARERAQKPLATAVPEAKQKKKPKQNQMETLMWASLIASFAAMLSAVIVLLVLLSAL